MRNKRHKFLMSILLFTAIFQGLIAVAQVKRTHNPESKHVLVISSYSNGYVWSDEIIDYIGTELMNRQNHYDVSVEHISSEYNEDFSVWTYRYNIITSAYEDRPPDILVLIGDEAWFAYRYSIKRPSFEKVQVIVVAAKNISFTKEQLMDKDSLTYSDHESTADILVDLKATGILRELNISGLFDVMEKMVKPLNNIYILTDFRIHGYYTRLLAQKLLEERGHPNGIFINSRDVVIDSLLTIVPKFKDSSAILISSWFTEGFGFRYSINYTYSQISKITKLAIFSTVGKSIENGLFTGGYFMPKQFWGEKAVELIEKVDSLGLASMVSPRLYKDSIFHINWKNAKERKLYMGAIPADSHIYDKPFDFFRRNKNELVIISGIFILLIISALLVFRSYIQVRKARERLMNSEDNLISALRKSQESDRLKSSFLANMSHEIRTPLNSILGFSELLSEAKSDEERKQYTKIISSSSDLLLRLIDDILDLSKIEAGTYEFIFERINLCDLLDELKQIFQHKERVGIEFIMDYKYEKLEIFADRNRLFQVLTNLVNNAIKFTKNGYIKITCTLEEFDGEKIVVIEIEDTGIGIPQDKIGSIFERFVKLNDLTEGAGLGLTICSSIIQKHKGTIDVKSTYGLGSKFTIRLPG